MFNQHGEMAEGDAPDPVAAADRFNYPQLAWGGMTVNGSIRTWFIDHVVNKKAEIIRVYLPPDEHAVSGGRPSPAQPSLQRDRCRQAAGLELPVPGRRGRALHSRSGNLGLGFERQGGEPDVVLGCAGDVPTLEHRAAAILREHLPGLKVRVVNVVDLMRLQPESEHPHGLPDAEFDSLFTTDRPIVFAYHGYPWLIHRLTYRRTNHANLHVRGYKEEGTTTTPFDMVIMLNDRPVPPVIDVTDRVPGSRPGRPAGAD